MHPKPRIVFDTNTYISALILPDSITKQALDLAIDQFELVVCEATWMELETRINKHTLQKYFASPEMREGLLTALNSSVRHVTVHSTITECRDPDDDKFLALAIDTGASLIVTGDKDLLVLNPWRGIEVLTPGDFYRAYSAR